MYLIGNKNAFGYGSMESLYYRDFTEGYDECGAKIDSIFNEYNALLLSPEYMMQDMFEAEGAKSPDSRNFVARLGKAIRELIKQIGENIKKFLSSFKKEDETFNKNQALIEAALKKDPELNKKVLELAKSGALDIRDIKDLNELQTEIDKLMEEKNPKTLKGKFEKLKKKWDDPMVTKTAKRIAFVASVVALGTALFKLHGQIRDNCKFAQEKAASTQKSLNELTDYMATHEHLDATQMSVLQQKLAIRKWEAGKIGEASAIVSNDYSKVNKVMGKILNWSKNSENQIKINEDLKKNLGDKKYKKDPSYKRVSSLGKAAASQNAKQRTLNAMNLHKGGDSVKFDGNVNRDYFSKKAKDIAKDAESYVNSTIKNKELKKTVLGKVTTDSFVRELTGKLMANANSGGTRSDNDVMNSFIGDITKKAIADFNAGKN